MEEEEACFLGPFFFFLSFSLFFERSEGLKSEDCSLVVESRRVENNTNTSER